MTYKRATAKVRAAGIEDIIIEKSLWGASPHNPMFERQTSQCFKTPDAAAEAVIGGFRPTHLHGPEIEADKAAIAAM